MWTNASNKTGESQLKIPGTERGSHKKAVAYLWGALVPDEGYGGSPWRSPNCDRPNG
jgi:hypothetical protein